MDDLEFFDQFGVWIVPNFLPQEKVNELRSLLREARKVKSEIGIEGTNQKESKPGRSAGSGELYADSNAALETIL